MKTTRTPHTAQAVKLQTQKRRTMAVALASLLFIGTGIFLSQQAHAQNYPTRPVKIVVPFATGGPADNYARFMAQRLQERAVLDSPQAVRQFFQLHLSALRHEVFAVMFLDVQNRMLAMEEMFKGTISQASVYPREVVKRALELNASAVILVHNHPSGDPTPSDADISMTHQVQEAAQVLGLVLHDHLIIGKSREISFRAAGYL